MDRHCILGCKGWVERHRVLCRKTMLGQELRRQLWCLSFEASTLWVRVLSSCEFVLDDSRDTIYGERENAQL